MTITINGSTGISGVDGSASTPAFQGGDSNTGISFPAADTVAISTNGSERVRCDSSGRVGIGTTSPGSLDPGANNLVVGSGSGEEGLTVYTGNTSRGIINFADGTSGVDTYVGQVAYDHSSNAMTFVTSAAERFRVDSSGRLLVGTSSAPVDGKLYVQGNSFSATEGGVLHLMRGEAATAITVGEEIGKIAFSDNAGKDFATITTLADAAAGINDYPGRLVLSTTADGASSPTERMRIRAEGSISMPGVYDFTTASAANVVVSSGGNLNRSSSSSKYKTDIETLQDSYADALLQCRPVWYRSTCKQDNPAWGWWGFIAEEVAAIDPRLVQWKTTEVTYDEKGSAVEAPCEPEPEGVAYDRFVPHLLNLIKRQKEQIEAMEARLSALESA